MKAMLSVSTLKRLINATKQFVRKNSNEDILSYIQLEFHRDSGTVTASAVDGYRLSIENGICDFVDDDFAVYIRPNIPKARKKETAVIEKSNDTCYINVDGYIVGYKQPDGEFFKCEKAVEETCKEEVKYRIGFNGEYLLSALQAAKASCGNNFRPDVVLEFRGETQPVLLRTNQEDVKMVLPLRLKN